jgi:hypothetical protein
MKTGTSRFRSELSIIPGWVWFVAVLAAMVGVAFLIHLGMHPHHGKPPSPPIFFILGVPVLACFVVCWILLLGYVNRDAARRGMSPALWTLICIFVANGIGFIIYFLLRKPMARYCNKCGFRVEEGFRFCPSCSSPQVPMCSQCGQPMKAEYACCPYCGQAAGAASSPVVTGS